MLHYWLRLQAGLLSKRHLILHIYVKQRLYSVVRQGHCLGSVFKSGPRGMLHRAWAESLTGHLLNHILCSAIETRDYNLGSTGGQYHRLDSKAIQGHHGESKMRLS